MIIGSTKIYILGASDSGKSTLAKALSEALADDKGNLPVHSAGSWVRENVPEGEDFESRALEHTLNCLKKNPHYSAILIDNFILTNLSRAKIIEGIRNPIDLYSSFRIDKDIFIILESCGKKTRKVFETSGLLACHEYISFLAEIGLIDSDRYIPLREKDYDLDELVETLKELL